MSFDIESTARNEESAPKTVVERKIILREG